MNMPLDPTSFEPDVREGTLFYRLFDEAESVRWKMADCDFGAIRPTDVPPGLRAVAREMLKSELTTFSATERFFADFGDDVDFTQWLTVWLYEETKHPSALLCWLDALGEKFDSRFMLQGRMTIPFMPSKMGTLTTNVISEMVAATLYVTVASRPGCEPTLRRICSNIAGDEARHAASFYSYAKKRLARSADPRSEKIAALKVLYFWMTPGLNSRVGHPVNMLANRCKEGAEIGEMLPREALEAAIDQTYRRACRVFESLLGLTLREPRDIGEQLTALEAS
ncbi:MAG: ferritin-like domain-containing protein [Polyangiaceae bacterium]